MPRSRMTVAELIAAADSEYKNGVENSVKLRGFKKCMEDNYEYMFDIEKHTADIVSGTDAYILPADCQYEDIIAVYIDDVQYLGKKVEDRWGSANVFERYSNPNTPDRQWIKLYPEPSVNSSDGIVIYYNKRPFFEAWGINPDGQLLHKNLATNGYERNMLNELAKDGDMEVDAGSGVAVGFTPNSLVDVTYSVSDEFAYTGSYSQKAVLNDDNKFLTYDVEFYDNEATIVAAIANAGLAVSCKLSSGPFGDSNQKVEVPEFIYVAREVDEPNKTGLDVYFEHVHIGTYPGPVTNYIDSIVVINLSRDFGYAEDDRPTNSDFVYYLQGYFGAKSEAEQAIINYIKYIAARTQKDIEMANGFYADYQEEIDKLYERKNMELETFLNFDSIDRMRRWF